MIDLETEDPIPMKPVAKRFGTATDNQRNGTSLLEHLARPGPQPHNQIGTLREMLALARTPRLGPQEAAQARLSECVERIVRRVMVEELPAAVEYIITSRHRGHHESS